MSIAELFLDLDANRICFSGRESIQEGLNAIALEYPKTNESLSPESLRHIQQNVVHLGEALEREIQTTTLTDMVSIANRMGNLEELFPQEIAMVGMWLVGGGNPSETSDAVYKESTQSLMRIMEKMKKLKKEPLTTEALGGAARFGSRRFPTNPSDDGPPRTHGPVPQI